MKEVTYQGMTFEPFITRDAIQQQVLRVAREIKRDCATPNPLLLCVLNGAFMFAADLLRACDIPQAEIAFIRFKSYDGTQSTGQVNEILGLTTPVAGREVIIVEDIVDTGRTAVRLRDTLNAQGARSVKMAALLFKPDALQAGTPPEYVGFVIPKKFIIGYGLDLDEQARNLSDIYVLKQ
ncbi:MAG: hypoxanthine phosphoribosyltransferase [Muribaculaceae bacterium]|nr:hypoxanthine phosphoribosyltransferase [Muribaculaceae bacterium]